MAVCRGEFMLYKTCDSMVLVLFSLLLLVIFSFSSPRPVLFLVLDFTLRSLSWVLVLVSILLSAQYSSVICREHFSFAHF